MPNWCENDLYFSGPDDEVARFKNLLGLDKTPPRFASLGTGMPVLCFIDGFCCKVRFA